MQACGERALETAPGFKLRLAAGDSLLRWDEGSAAHQGDLVALAEGREEFAYFTEDAALLAEYLRPGQYTVAVGNPPYITVKDKVLNERYRGLQDLLGQLRALSAIRRAVLPARATRDESGRAGFVGQITANSFMKREFGKKLIEEFFAQNVELSHIIDTSGCYIPGHGTPTVILWQASTSPQATDGARGSRDSRRAGNAQ